MVLEATFRRCVQCGHNVVGTVGNNVQVGCADAKGPNVQYPQSKQDISRLSCCLCQILARSDS